MPNAGHEPRAPARRLQALVGQFNKERILRERVPIAELARRFDLDRKTIRCCVRDASWEPYRRPARSDTLLAEHPGYLRERAQHLLHRWGPQRAEVDARVAAARWNQGSRGGRRRRACTSRERDAPATHPCGFSRRGIEKRT